MLFRTARTRVSVNGAPGERIWHRRGVRQRDPISPMIFILAMDALGSLFAKAESEGLFQDKDFLHLSAMAPIICMRHK